jgi:serine/threonine protein kinase
VSDDHEAYIADFGLSRILGESGFTTKSVSGTYRWMAPELLAPEGEYVPQVTTASDVWAFGMTVLEVRFSVRILIGNPHSHTPYLYLRYLVADYHSVSSSTISPSFTVSREAVGQHTRHIRRSAATYGHSWNCVGIQNRLCAPRWNFSRVVSHPSLRI